MSRDQQAILPSTVTWIPDPHEVTNWLVEFRSNTTRHCPLGYVCNQTHQASCTEIRLLSIAYGFGDVHAGGWCPEGRNQLLLCPVGHYCPTAEEIHLCPKGYYCPLKTAVPEIECWSCLQGEERMVREWYGYLLIIFLFFFSLVWIVVGVIRKHRSDVFGTSDNRRSSSFDSLHSLYRENTRQKELERLERKLFAVQKRLENRQQQQNSISKFGASQLSIFSSTNITSLPLLIDHYGNIDYDAGPLFDVLNTDNNEQLSYGELQCALELNVEQIEIFARRMNQLAGNDSGTRSVCRSAFESHFLQVLGELSYFEPTTSEVEELFDELAHGEDWASYDTFFGSILPTFLTYPQIKELIAEFRKCDAFIDHMDTKQTRKCKSVPHFAAIQDMAARISNTLFFTFKRSSKPRLRFQLDPQAHSRWFRMESFLAARKVKQCIHREVFCTYYTELLTRVTKDALLESHEKHITQKYEGVDLAFQNLSLELTMGSKKVNVVNQVSGRLPAHTMTALMGGSGAGKTSLLNALCGRAYYGNTTGTILINGHVTTIEEHKSCTGFVPQDDIVHAELTVRENLIYSGRFSLPKGTTLTEIEEYADIVMMHLGLSKVADSIVGDVNRRGVSGGEKKRVNIGVELMSKPSILFLDEPTSGLDSSSALLVMGSLKKLVENQGVTVLSVIHQPRKAIFDSFDSLILLGADGNMVYHGPVTNAQTYFANLPQPYLLPVGESVADWLIDVSSGRLMTTGPIISSAKMSNRIEERNRKLKGEFTYPSPPGRDGATMDEDGKVGNNVNVDMLYGGPSKTEFFEHSLEKAKERRHALYDCWYSYYNTRSHEELERYTPPEPYDLPKAVEKPLFWTQLGVQIERNLLILWRNRNSKLIDTTMIVGAVVLISLLQGVTEVARPQHPALSFDQLIECDPYEVPKTFPYLFKYAAGPTTVAVEFALKVGVITSVLLGLTAAKTLTAKRLEFFRESGSGLDINAYYLAINVTSTLEHCIQMFLASSCAYWLRDSLTPWYSFQVQFLILMWMTVSWSLLIPLLFPVNNAMLAVGFFMAFFGLLFSGGIDPTMYTDIYEEGNEGMALFSGIMSVTRFFIEGMTVQEQRCLPVQSGFTVEPTSVNFPVDLVGSFHLTGLAQNDLSVVQRSCNGWYGGVLPAFLVGTLIRVFAFGILHVSDRSRQNKRSLLIDLKKRPLSGNMTLSVVVRFVVLVLVLFALTSWVILTPNGDTGILEQPSTADEALELVNMAIDYVAPLALWVKSHQSKWKQLVPIVRAGYSG